MHDEKIHYKMYKDGKQWAFAAIVTFTFTIVPMTLTTNHAAAASADEPAVSLQNSAATSSSSTVTLSATATRTAATANSAAASTTNSLTTSTIAEVQPVTTTASSQSAATSAGSTGSTTMSQISAAAKAGQETLVSSTATPKSSQAAATSKNGATSQLAVNSQASMAKTVTLNLELAAATPAVSADAIANSLVANGLNDTAATFSVKDPEYPSSMYVDPDTNHYTFFWATSRDNQTGKTGEYNIILSTDRSGSGILYVTILDSTNKIPLNEYTINEDDYEYDVETSKDLWSRVYLGRIYNDHYSGVIRNLDSRYDYNWSPRFNVNQGGAVSDSTYYSILSFMIPKLVTQTTSYVDDSGNQIAQSHVQQGLSGQIYTTTGGKVVSGYYETVPGNSSGYMSEFGKINDTYTKNWHNGDKVDFTQTGADGTMRADYYYNNRLRGSYTLTPSGAGSSVTVTSGSGGNLTIYNIYIPQTRNVQYVYKKLGNLVIDSTDAAFDAAKKTKTQYANDPNDATRAADVTLPTIAGFVPFINGIAVTDYTFNPTKYITSLDQDINVVYRAKQKARVDFIDQDSGNQVIFSSGTLTDYDGQPINFSTADQLKQLVYDAKTNPNGKYDLVKDGFPTGATYDSNANADQVYQVVLKHHHETVDGKTDPTNGQKTVKRTIEYYYQGDGKAARSVEQGLTFTRTGDRDRVTGETIWEDWSKVAAQNVEHVDSPKINGYTADKLTVAGATIKATDKDSTVTVTYVPNKQAVKVIYHDDTTNQDLAVKEFSGNSGADSGRNTKAAIAEYVKQHLKLVSDDTNGQNIIFDKDDQNDQTYVVHFVHETEAVKRTKTVTETIEHHKAIKQLDGTTKYVDVKDQLPVYKDTLTFNESGVHDLYTDQTIWNGDWTPTQTFKTVVSPTLAGYTPDVAQVDAVAITVTDANYGQSLNVHHDIIYVGKSQILVVNYLDDTTHQVLEHWTGTGQSGQTLDYTTAATINKYLGQHYVLVSDATNGKQPVLDEDDISNNQVLEVHLKHQTTSTSRTMKVTEEIKYVYKGDANYKDGTLVDQSLLKQANPLTRELVFEQDGVIDNVTNTTTWNQDWKQTKSFKAVTTPNLKGYSVSVDEVPAQSVTIDASTFDQKGKTYSFTVNYTPLKQTALIKYIDGSDNDKVLETDTQTGLFNQKLDYTSIRNQILAKYANYEVASDETENGIVFNDDAGQDQIFKIVLKHKTAAVTHSVEVKQIIHFKFSDNHQQPWDQTSTLTFTQNGVKDLVTDQIDWDSSYSETQYFKEVEAKPIAGYTPDIQTLASRKITVTNDNFVNGQFEGTITYSPNRQYISVSYIDDTTGKQLANEVLNGYSNTVAIDKDQTPAVHYHTTSTINDYLDKGYELVSDPTNGKDLMFDASDDPNDQTYIVHLKHGYEDTQRTKTVVEEIRYQYENGSQAHDPYHKELTFTQNGQLDKVTKTTDWNGAWSAAQTLAKVDSPTIPGYHNNYASEPEHTITITNDNYDTDLNIYRTVTYYADSQNVAIVYVDTKTNNAIASESLEGKTGEQQTYSAQDFITKKLTNYQNYTIAKDETQKGIKFPADGKLMVYHVYLDHKTEAVSRTANVKQIIHYQSTDGLKLAADATVTKQASQTGEHDLVDDTTVWGEWTQAKFDPVQAPTIAGYNAPNPDQIGDESSTVTNDNWQQDNTLEHTILYTPKSQKATITFIDDDAKDATDRQMATVTLNGHSNADSGYNTKSAITRYELIGYVKVSDGTNGQNVIFDANDAADQSFEVHFKHGKKSTSRDVTYQRVITYIYGNGGKAGQNVFDPETQTLKFTQNGIQDRVNRQVAWDKVDAQSFREVPSEKIAGYVYDKAVVPASEISPADSDFAQKTVVINETVTYTAQPQKAKIYFIDGTTPTGRQLRFKELSGLSDMNSGYTTTDMIKDLKQLHYQLLTDETNGQEIVFDHNDEDQVYYVYFGHETKNVSRTKTVTETIDYVKDGAVLSDQRVTKELNFTQNGVKDLVNNIVDWNGTWTPTQKFAAVPSPTFKGYKAVPGQVDEIAITVNNDNYNQNLNVYKQVVYTANPQSAYIEYFDQDTGTIIGEKNLTGTSNQLSDYSTVNVINAWVAKGYDLVKDETGGQPIRFDDDDNVSQSFVVYLKHRHAEVKRPVKVQRVVHYVFRDGPKQGQKAASDYHDPAADLTFEQTGDEDLVTHTVVYDASYKNQAQFGELILTHGAVYDAIAKLIPGYHLSVNTLSPKTVVIDADTFDKASDGVFTVADTVYYIIDNQLANINYVDDDLDEKVVTIDHTTGQSGAKSSYDSAKTLARLIYNEQTNPTGQYDLVSDGTKDGIVFDLDDQVDQTFVIHLKHHILKQAANREKTIKQTVLYKYADGTQAADPYYGKDMTFKQTGDLDMVTGAIDWNGAWTTDERQGKFDDVTSPTIKGYTPDVTVLSHSPLTMDNDKYGSPIDLLDIVTYSPNDQTAIIKYVDIDNGGSLVAYDEAKGKTNEQINYDTKDQLGKLVYDEQTNPTGKYVLVSDGFAQALAAAQAQGQQLRFDNDDQNYQLFTIYLRHHYSQVEPETDPASGMRKVSQIIHYVYQNTQQSAANDNVQILTFKRTGYRDDVTGKVFWSLWETVASQKTVAVVSPKINGYTADKLTVAGITIKATDKDSTVTVTYVPNKQAVNVIYHDDTTNQDLAVKEFSGNSGADSGRNTKAAIAEYVKKHLKLVSDDTNGQNIIFDKDDQSKQTYVVHFVHETETVKRTKTVTETIEHHKAIKQLNGTTKYVDVKNQIPVYTATLTFNESGVHDLYTDQTAWNGNWTPTQTFKEVVSPALVGYTPDVAKVDAVAITVTDANYGQSLNVHHDIIYVGKSQILVVNYIDDTTPKVLEYWTGTGQSGQTLDYTTTATINKYLGQHYVLVSDDTNEKQPVLDEDDISNNQVLEVHLKHQTTNTSRTMKVTEEIRYAYKGDANYKDGTLVDQSLLKQANPLTNELVFEQDGVIDNVTGTTTWNKDWKQIKSFKAVTTPNLKGYTVSVDEISAKSVTIDASTFDQKGKTYSFTVNYTPLKQTALIKYIDGSDNDKELDTDTQTGLSNQKLDYTSIRNQILAKYANYEVASDETENGIVFNDDAGQDQIFKIVLKHKTSVVTRSVDVKQIIHFKFSDNHRQPWDQTSTLTFTQNGVKDLVTDQTDWNSGYSETQYFKEVTADHVDGYTPDIQTIAQRKITVTNQNFVAGQFKGTITYSPNRQYISVSYIDDTTGKQLANKVLKGYSNASANYSTTETIKNYLGQGYELVSDDTGGAALKFNSSDKPNDQIYAVHLKHGYEDTTRTKTVVEEIKYQYENGSQAHDPYRKELTFKQSGQLDKVTKVTNWNGASWSAAQTLAKVDSPTIAGYHYDYAGEPEHMITITNDNYDTDLDIYRTVTYYADSQNVAIVYVDNKTNNAIASESLEGKTGDHEPYSAQNFITKNLTNYQNYTIAKDGTQDGIKFPTDGQLRVYYVYLDHKTETVSRTANVKQIIHYQSTDGRKLAEDKIVTKAVSQTGTHDLVDGTTTWNAWTQADFDPVQAPTIAGYNNPNPDQIVGESSTITNDNWQQDNTLEHTILYTPKSQTATITFIDDDAKDATDRQMSTLTLSGYSNADSGYNTKLAIDGYEQMGYVKVSDGTNGQNVIFDANDAAGQSFEVHFKHGKKSTSRNVTYQRVVTYIYGNGGKAGQNVFAPKTQTLEFTQNGIQDLVNKQVTWDKLDPQTFTEIASPKMDGYEYDKAVVPAAAIKPTEDAFDKETVVVNETVTYTAQPQKAKIYFIDGTTPTGRQLLFKELSGLSDMNSGYTTTDMIEGLEKLHYQLLTDETNGQEIVFDHDDEDQVYYVYFGHETEKDSRAKTVTETIDYVKDGAVLSDQRVTKELNFTQNGVKDLVNNIVDWNGTWTSTQKFAAVPSPTIKGYKAVPGQVDEIAITVNNDNYNQNLNVYKQVVYTANLQSAYIEYFDQDTGTIIGEKNLTGLSNQLSDYTTRDEINTWEEKGYELVKDETGGQPIRFDDDDNVSQSFVVYLKHRHAEVKRPVKVQRVVHYVFRDGPKQGQKAASDYHDPVADLTFEQTGDEDLVTHTIVYDATYKKQAQFGELILTHGADYDAIAKLIPGYHLSVNTLSPKTVVIDADTFDKASDGVFTVADTVYYIIDNQLANINYVDDDLDEKVVTMEQTTGKSGAKSSYDSAKTLARLIYNEQTNPTGQYDLISDGTKDGIVFDLDDQVDQTFVVHLKHHILKQSAKREKTIKQTVLYKYADGTQAADPYYGKDMTFKQTGDLDMVTGMIDWNGVWTTDERQGKFVDVSSPTIKGYTPDVTILSHSPLTMDNDKYDSPIDLLDIVTYSPNDQMAIIKYVDIDNGGSLVAYDEAKGKTNEQINYDTKNQLSQLVYDAQTNPAGKYVLVSDGFAQAQAAAQAKGEQLRFDNDDQNYQLFTIYLRHHYSQVEPETDPASGMRKVSQIIHYVYQNSQQSAANDNVQVLTFKRTGYRDDVTGQVSWPLWETIAAQKTNAVDSPTIKGYTPDNSVIGENEIAAAQKGDVVIYVNYTADPQHAQIDYVDQDTGQTIQSDTVDGVSDAKIDYSTADQIKQLTNKGYVLVSDEFTQAQDTGKAVFDQDGNALQTFIVTLKHGTQVIDPNNPDPDNPILPATPINPADPTGPAWPAKDEYDQTVQAIVHYQDDDGNTMAPDNVQTARWTRMITVDEVTGRIIAATDWTSDPTEYATVSSPVIDGYTPDQTTVAFEMTPTDQVKTVIYAKNAVPVEPEQPTKPSQPVEPEQPTKPSQPVEPEQPTKPSQPVEPEQPTKPSQPIEPEQPTKPSQPVEPEQPAEPSRPTAPSETVQPGIVRDSQSMQTSVESPTTKTTMKQLPQTGNDNVKDASWSIMGLLTSLLSMLGLAGHFKKKHDHG